MTDGVRERHHPAERLAHHDRLLDLESLAERRHVVAPLLEAPALARTRVAPPVAAMVEVDHLRNVREPGEEVPVAGMVDAGSPVGPPRRRRKREDLGMGGGAAARRSVSSAARVMRAMGGRYAMPSRPVNRAACLCREGGRFVRAAA